MLNENIIFIGVVINLIFTLFYIRSIFTGTTRPNLVSWFIWMLAPFIGVFLQLQDGAGLSVLGTFMPGFVPFLVILFALFKKNAFWKINSFDLICGLFSIIALVIYFLTKDVTLAIIFAILSDGLAAIPTFVKSWTNPESENWIGYIGGIITNILALLIIKDWSFSIYGFSVYFILINTFIILTIYRKQFFGKILIK
jgi:hypothetical protein